LVKYRVSHHLAIKTGIIVIKNQTLPNQNKGAIPKIEPMIISIEEMLEHKGFALLVP
jgi:hypothetical protein